MERGMMFDQMLPGLPDKSFPLSYYKDKIGLNVWVNTTFGWHKGIVQKYDEHNGVIYVDTNMGVCPRMTGLSIIPEWVVFKAKLDMILQWDN